MWFDFWIKLAYDNYDDLFDPIWVIYLMLGFFNPFKITEVCLLYFLALRTWLSIPALEN